MKQLKQLGIHLTNSHSHTIQIQIADLNATDKKFSKNTNPSALPRGLYVKYHATNANAHVYSKRNSNGACNLLVNLNKRQLGGRMDTCSLVQPELYRSINTHTRILGHLSAVYCVCFDRTGRYVLTGADDHLIKVWRAHDARLVATLRGHQKEISDVDINYENTLVASGSCDKTIRIWNMRTTESMTILHAHTSMVTSVEVYTHTHTHPHTYPHPYYIL